MSRSQHPHITMQSIKSISVDKVIHFKKFIQIKCGEMTICVCKCTSARSTARVIYSSRIAFDPCANFQWYWNNDSILNLCIVQQSQNHKRIVKRLQWHYCHKTNAEIKKFGICTNMCWVKTQKELPTEMRKWKCKDKAHQLNSAREQLFHFVRRCHYSYFKGL